VGVEPAVAALVVAGALHAGFQGTVTALVYPALARLRPEDWVEGHARHSRAIVPLVVVVYAAVLGAVAWSLVADPTGWVAASAAAQAVALGVTATLAAPLHGRLSDRDEALVVRLLRVDRVRAAAAVAGLLLAGVAALVG